MISLELLKEISQIHKNLDKKYENMNLSEREMTLAQSLKLSEEIGELQSDLLAQFFERRDGYSSKESLALEFADVQICLLILAERC